ncbi:hypothetical protein Q4Q39_04910 [Flavivirga amylovorans]|uniref:Uncharacterized protein n=1 Tax=Flavivirga amylovorans TaxID=870486 RepID=A0ABT8WYK1_9FLAO|nr:hypothetical protein [Flavivirga amylovorans]MDO5986743.1 hypothetical protein [Flavivirga amylovorans]
MKFNLNIHCFNNEISYSLYDGYDEPQLEGIHTDRTIELDKGVYFLEAELNGIVKQVKIRLDGDKSINVPSPIYSSMPLYDAVTTSESKLFDGLKYSSQLTDPASGNKHFQETGFFIFLRSSDLDRQTIRPEKFRIFILDKSQQVIREINTSNSKLDERGYWMAYSGEFSPGQYFVEVELRNKAWCFPVYIYPQIKANLFLTVKNVPLYRSLKIFYNEGYNAFQPENKHTISTDIALDRLANFQFDNLPKDTMNELLNEKFEQPMFGFLSLYFLLLRKKRPEKRLIETVINNMQYNILRTEESPELDILKRMANAKLGTNFQINKHQNVLVPMFSFGLDTIISDWNNDKTLFDEESPINDATDNLLRGTPFSIWSVDRLKRVSFIKMFVNKVREFPLIKDLDTSRPNHIRLKGNNEFINTLLGNVNINEDKLNSLMEYLYFGGKNDKLTIDLIIKELRISPYRLKKVMNVVNNIIETQPNLLTLVIKRFNNELGLTDGLNEEDKELKRVEDNIKKFISANSN